MKDDNFIEEFAKYLVKHIIVRPIEEKDVQRHLRQNTGMFIQKVMEEFQLDTLDNSVIQKALRDLESTVRQLVDQENKVYQDWVDNYKDYDEPEEKPYGYKAELDNQDGSFDIIAITTDLTRDEFYKRLSRRYDMETVRIVPCYSKAELNESARTKNARFTSLRESSSHIKTDFDVDKDGFYLNYSADELKGWLYVDLAKDDVDVEYHWENGDYYGPENDSGPLSGGYYDRGYEIDDIHIPTEYMNEHFFDENDNEISKNEFLRLNNLNEKLLSSYLNNAKESLSSEIEDYVYDNEEDFIQE